MGQPWPLTAADADLVREARHGFKEPMAELLHRHRDVAVLLAGRVLGSPDLAHDAVQEAAIAAMTDLDRLRSPEAFGAWFCGIALNVSRRWLRQLQPEMPGAWPEAASGSPDPAEVAETADTAARVRGAIATLADGQQHAVRLFYLQGLSHREVAEELGISVGAVKARLHQARAALAPKLVQFRAIPEVCTMTATDTASWTEVFVAEVRRTQDEDPRQRKHLMILAERGGDRRLPIWIGPAEATVLALTLESVETPRPFPYKLAAGLVEAAGAQINEVRVTRLLDGIFYAAVVVQGPDGPREVDARPSDAVNLALVSGAPIRLNNELFDVAQACSDELPSFPVADYGSRYMTSIVMIVGYLGTYAGQPAGGTYWPPAGQGADDGRAAGQRARSVAAHDPARHRGAQRRGHSRVRGAGEPRRVRTARRVPQRPARRRARPAAPVRSAPARSAPVRAEPARSGRPQRRGWRRAGPHFVVTARPSARGAARPPARPADPPQPARRSRPSGASGGDAGCHAPGDA